MTERQRQIARHMLGLPTASGRSYRNRFFASEGHQDHPTLIEMENAGLVTCWRLGGTHRPLDRWHLTRSAAESVLLPGESLDPEDFPS